MDRDRDSGDGAAGGDDFVRKSASVARVGTELRTDLEQALGDWLTPAAHLYDASLGALNRIYPPEVSDEIALEPSLSEPNVRGGGTHFQAAADAAEMLMGRTR